MTERNDLNPNVNEWNDSLSGDFLWSSTNFGEAITDVMTPLTWSVIQFTLDDWIYVPGISTIGNIGGYPYVNISVFWTVFRSLGRSRHDLLRTLEGTLYLNLPDEMEIPGIHLSWRMAVSLFQCLLRIQQKQNRGENRLPTYLATNLDWFTRLREKLQSEQENYGLIELWQKEIKPHIKAFGQCWEQ